jgi:hypothetical protein
MANARFDWFGLDAVEAGVARSISGGLQDDLVDNLHTAAPVLRADIVGGAFTRVQRRAASNVNVNRIGTGIEASGGGRGGLGGVLWNGGEYGGRKSRKETYATRSPLGRPYTVQRRSTMQFLPHLGNEGYFFWPAVRDWMPRLEEQTQQIVERALGGGR